MNISTLIQDMTKIRTFPSKPSVRDDYEVYVPNVKMTDKVTGGLIKSVTVYGVSRDEIYYRITIEINGRKLQTSPIWTDEFPVDLFSH